MWWGKDIRRDIDALRDNKHRIQQKLTHDQTQQLINTPVPLIELGGARNNNDHAAIKQRNAKIRHVVMGKLGQIQREQFSPMGNKLETPYVGNRGRKVDIKNTHTQ